MKLLIRLIVNLLLSIDQLANTILLGHPDETISSRLGRTKGQPRYFWVKWLRHFVDGMFFFDTQERDDGTKMMHCEKSIMPLEQENFRTISDYEIWDWNKKN